MGPDPQRRPYRGRLITSLGVAEYQLGRRGKRTYEFLPCRCLTNSRLRSTAGVTAARASRSKLSISSMTAFCAPAREAACLLRRMGRTEARPSLLRLLREVPSAAVIEPISAIADEECLVILGRIARTRPDLADAALAALDTSGRRVPRRSRLPFGDCCHRSATPSSTGGQRPGQSPVTAAAKSGRRRCRPPPNTPNHSPSLHRQCLVSWPPPESGGSVARA